MITHACTEFIQDHTCITEFIQDHACMYRVHTCVSPVECGRHCFLGIIHSFWLLKSFCIPQCSLSPEGRDLMDTSPFRSECSGSVLSGFESTETGLPRQTTASCFLLPLQKCFGETARLEHELPCSNCHVNWSVSEGRENHQTKCKAKGVEEKLLVHGRETSKENTALATSGTCPGQAQHQSQSWEVKRLQGQLVPPLHVPYICCSNSSFRGHKKKISEYSILFSFWFSFCLWPKYDSFLFQKRYWIISRNVLKRIKE